MSNKKVTSTFASLVAEPASMSGVGTVTATPVEIKLALEASTLTTAKIYIVMKIVDHMVEKGLVKMDEFILKINSEFIDDPETINYIIEAIGSITSKM